MPFRCSASWLKVQAKSDLLAYVSQYVTLQRQGREYVGLCPFHAEKTPSFHISMREKQVWHCHGCDAGGDLIKFVERYENVDFPTALRMLAARALASCSRKGQARSAAAASARRSMKQNAAAQRFFADFLPRHDRKALDYVHKRGITDETAAIFGIGYVRPRVGRGLDQSKLQRAGIDVPLAERAGLLRQKTGYYDFFRNRLMLPIYNLNGEVMAFGGRALGDETPKYLPQHAEHGGLHQKARTSTRCNWRGARQAREPDTPTSWSRAISTRLRCIKPVSRTPSRALGTARSRPSRRASCGGWPINSTLCFDGDAAGQAATARSIDMLVEEGLAVSIVALPGGVDPDELILEQGAEALGLLLASAQRWVDFKIDLAYKRIASKFATKSDIAREAMTVINQVRDPIERDQYVKSDGAPSRRQRKCLAPNARAAADATTPATRKTGRRSGARSPRSHNRCRPSATCSSSSWRDPSCCPRRSSASARTTSKTRSCVRCSERLAEHEQDLKHGGVNPLTIFADDAIGSQLTRMALDSPPLPHEDDERRLALIAARF